MYLRFAKEITQEGYDRYRGSMFKVPYMNRWTVILTGPKLIGDLRNASEKDLSFQVGSNEVCLHSRTPLELTTLAFYVGVSFFL